MRPADIARAVAHAIGYGVAAVVAVLVVFVIGASLVMLMAVGLLSPDDVTWAVVAVPFGVVTAGAFIWGAHEGWRDSVRVTKTRQRKRESKWM